MMVIDQNIYKTILNDIRPYLVNDKIRLGRPYDGGYVLSRVVLEKTRYVLSLGINDEWSFEKDFVRQFKIEKLVMIDDRSSYRDLMTELIKVSIVRVYKPFNKVVKNSFAKNFDLVKSFWQLKNSTNTLYHKVRAGNHTGEVTLKNIIKGHALDVQENSVFLKIDIEGSEYDLIQDIIDLNYFFSGLVIEFHRVLTNPEQINKAVQKLNSSFYIYHTHYNNYTERNEWIADALEISFAHRKFQNSICKLDESNYPIAGLDYSSNPGQVDYVINWI